MSNSSLATYTLISPNSTNPRNHKIDTITIHHIAGVLSAYEIANLPNFRDPAFESSCNYAVGNDGDIALIVEEENRSWCTSSRENDHRAITIEVSNSFKGDPWPVSDKALEATINLCVDICKRNGIEKINYTGDKTGNLTMHKWFAATGCPGPYLSEKYPYIAEEINRRLGVETEDPTPEKEEPVAEKRELHLGDKGEDVEQLQNNLIELGYDLGDWGADGDFGAMTDKAVRDFQESHNLEADGWVGKNTYAALEVALEEKRMPAPAPAPTPTPVEDVYYRVRKSWDDPSSQIGAFIDLEKAIPFCEDAGEEYKVYDPNGKQLYPEVKKESYMVRITAKALNVRKGPSMEQSIVNVVSRGGAYTIVDEESGWGLLKAYASMRDGWIDLKHTQKI